MVSCVREFLSACSFVSENSTNHLLTRHHPHRTRTQTGVSQNVEKKRGSNHRNSSTVSTFDEAFPLRYAILRRAALRCAALRCAALLCVGLSCAALRCAALRCAALCCVVRLARRSFPLCCAVLYCAALRSAALRCVALRWAALR